MRRGLSTSAKQYLLDLGYDEKVAKGVVEAFLPSKPSVSDLKGLGSNGLKTLVESVRRDIASKNWSDQSIRVRVKVPRERTEFDINVPIGQTFYQVAKQNPDLGQYLECACSGVAACSTCHVIVEEEFFRKLTPPNEDELDMLDLAADPAPTSRLGCQIKFTKDLDGLTIQIPKSVNNLFK